MSGTSREAGPAIRSETLGGALVGLASVLFGTVVVFGKFALRTGLPVFSVLAFRFTASALIVAAALTGLRRPLAAAPGERLGLVAVGMAGYAVEASFFFAALRHGTAAAVTLLFFTYPVFVTLASWALGRGRPTRLTLASLACAVVGAALVVGTGGGLAIEALGALFVLGSAVTYTGYLIGAHHVLKRTSALTGAMWQAASAGLGLAAFAGLTGNFRLPSGWGQWGPILGMAVSTAGAFFCLLEGLQRLGAVRTAIISATEPLAAALLAFAFLGEAVSPGTAVGGALILAGAVTGSLARATPAAEPPLP